MVCRISSSPIYTGLAKIASRQCRRVLSLRTTSTPAFSRAASMLPLDAAMLLSGSDSSSLSSPAPGPASACTTSPLPEIGCPCSRTANGWRGLFSHAPAVRKVECRLEGARQKPGGRGPIAATLVISCRLLACGLRLASPPGPRAGGRHGCWLLSPASDFLYKPAVLNTVHAAARIWMPGCHRSLLDHAGRRRCPWRGADTARLQALSAFRAWA